MKHSWYSFLLDLQEFSFSAPLFIISLGEHLKTFGPSTDKAIPLQALTGPEGSRNLRLLYFKTFGT
jgi:hypothetical protein